MSLPHTLFFYLFCSIFFIQHSGRMINGFYKRGERKRERERGCLHEHGNYCFIRKSNVFCWPQFVLHVFYLHVRNKKKKVSIKIEINKKHLTRIFKYNNIEIIFLLCCNDFFFVCFNSRFVSHWWISINVVCIHFII